MAHFKAQPWKIKNILKYKNIYENMNKQASKNAPSKNYGMFEIAYSMVHNFMTMNGYLISLLCTIFYTFMINISPWPSG